MRKTALSKQQWQSLVAEHGESTLTVTKFCQSKGISKSQFYYYKKKLETHSDSSGFMQAQVIEHRSMRVVHTQTSAPQISLQYGGARLDLSDSSPEYLASLLKGLAS